MYATRCHMVATDGFSRSTPTVTGPVYTRIAPCFTFVPGVAVLRGGPPDLDHDPLDLVRELGLQQPLRRQLWGSFVRYGARENETERPTEYRFARSIAAAAHNSGCLRIAARLCWRLVLVHTRSLYRRIGCGRRRSRSKCSSVGCWCRSRVLEVINQISATHTISPLSHLPKHPILMTPRAVRGWHRPMSTRRHCSPRWHKNWVCATKNSDRKSTRLNSSHSGESRMPSSA